MVTVLVITVTIDLLLAVGVGMVMASFLFMKRMTDMQIRGISTIRKPGEDLPLADDEKAVLTAAEEQILLFHLSGPMSFSSAKAMVRRHASIAGYRIMLLDLTDVPVIDFTTSRAIEDIIEDTRSAGRDIFLVGTQPSVRSILEKHGILRHFNPGHIYQRRIDALLHAGRLLKDAQEGS
jgi:SulP family sulfate permease